jgi:hypothetical protein
MVRGRCALCLLVKNLQDSHLLPKSLYKKTRTPGATNPNPTLVTSRGTVQTSRQIKDYLLCEDCEGLFSRNGEDYVMRQVAHRGEFPLLDTLRAAAATKSEGGFDWYDKVAVPGIDRDKLGYFSLSVFWRASVHVWKEPGEEPISIELGPYEEELRKYLLGQSGFPRNVVLLLVACTDVLSQDLFYSPSRGRKSEDTTYTLQARGLNFFMLVGKQIPQSMRQLCSVTGPDKWICSRSCEEKTRQADERLSKARRFS